MIQRSSIYMMRPDQHQPGECSVCGELAQLKFVDSATNEALGDCCLNVMVRAEAALAETSKSPATSE